MHAVPTLMTDLTIITIYAGLITLLFKYLKQPLVLGYVLAGILAGPHFSFLPTITDKENITIWADIGVIFLLFGLGLEFSFKKIVNVGKAAMITANANILFMLFLGYNVGQLLGWSTIDSVFLGGMISMSSTTIIIKAFEELNLKKQRFTDLVFGVLVVEDMVGILLLVLLPTIALSNSVNGTELLLSTAKLISFLVLCFVFGVYIVPTFMKKVMTVLNDEMLLVISVALCMGMVLLATTSGFSSALGAFVMGSILAESEIVKRIENVLKPVKDLFGAIFFVSVGMLVDPAMFVVHWYPILVITLLVISGKILFSCFGFLVSGQSLKTSISGGFSLAQVGEFAFIIAALGMSLKVLNPSVYPIIVAVSVITTFTTPLMIKAATPFYEKIRRRLPQKWLAAVDKNTVITETHVERNMWSALFKNYFTRIFLFSIILIGIMNISFQICEPALLSFLPTWFVNPVLTVLTLGAMAPFLNALLVSKGEITKIYLDLWAEKKANRLPIILLTTFKVLIAVLFVIMVVTRLLTSNPYVVWFLVATSIVLLFKSKWIFTQYLKIETQFLVNLNRDQMETQFKNTKDEAKIKDEEKWLDSSLFVALFTVAPDSVFVGKALRETGFRETYAINVFKIIRPKQSVTVPGGGDQITPDDKLLLVGTGKQIRVFQNAVKAKGILTAPLPETDQKTVSLHDYILKQEDYHVKTNDMILCYALPVTQDSSLNGNTIMNSDIRGKTKCLVVGVERKSSLFINPDRDFAFKEGDLIWIVGPRQVMTHEIFSRLSLDSEATPVPA